MVPAAKNPADRLRSSLTHWPSLLDTLCSLPFVVLLPMTEHFRQLNALLPPRLIRPAASHYVDF